MKNINFQTTALIGVALVVALIIINYLVSSLTPGTATQGNTQVTPQPGATLQSGTLKLNNTQEVKYLAQDTLTNTNQGSEIFVFQVEEASEDPLSAAELSALKNYFAGQKKVPVSQINIEIKTTFYHFEDGEKIPLDTGDGSDVGKGTEDDPEPINIPLRKFLKVSDLRAAGYQVTLLSDSKIQVLLRGSYTKEQFTEDILKRFPDWKDYQVKFEQSDL